jgi:DNA topoisomerase III
METAGKLVDDEQLKEALKERGLGTPATRAAIIETLLARGYITREKKALAATDPGRYLVAIVQDRGLKSPELTGEWEAKLREVEHGRLDPRRFMEEITRYTGEVIRAGDSAAIDPGRLGDCPRCARPVIEGKRGFGCSGWREGCPFVLWREYRGVPLGEGQVRELLQRRVLLRPVAVEGAGQVLLQLMDSGDIAEIPVPAGGPRRPTSPAGRPPSGGRKAPRNSRPRKAAGAGAAGDAPPRERAKGFAPVALGPCPLCKSEVVEQEKSYGCSGWKQGCRFTIWKTIAGKKIGVRTAQALLREGRSSLLKGFESKSGKPFEARLKVDGAEVRFDFGS